MRKIGTGYTNYFNQKYERNGALCQGLFKAVAVKKDKQLIHLPYYIHVNPLDLLAPKWKENGLPNVSDALTFLKNYRWSSFPDYIGKKNFPSVTQRNLIEEISGNPKEYEKNFTSWLRDFDLSSIEEITLE